MHKCLKFIYFSTPINGFMAESDSCLIEILKPKLKCPETMEYIVRQENDAGLYLIVLH